LHLLPLLLLLLLLLLLFLLLLALLLLWCGWCSRTTCCVKASTTTAGSPQIIHLRVTCDDY
jgi:hypothetical protein